MSKSNQFFPQKQRKPKQTLLQTEDWNVTLNELYNKTTNIPIVDQPKTNVKISDLMTVICIDGKLHLPCGRITSGMLSKIQPNESVYVCGTKSVILRIVSPYIDPKPYNFSNCKINDIDELIYTTMILGIENAELFKAFGEWMLGNKSERLEGKNESFIIDRLLSNQKELAYQLRDYLQLPQNTQKVFSSMVLEEGISDISCSVENLGVIAGFIAENIIREGGKWYKELQKLLITAIIYVLVMGGILYLL